MKRWIVDRYDVEAARSLASRAKISDLTAFLLIKRGISEKETAEAFLNANLNEHLRKPESLPGCVAVAEKLYKAIKNQQKIVIYGDYDVDGITGTVILYHTVKDLGGNADYYVPSRLDEGYGLNSEAVRKLAAGGASVIVTVDCGIGSVAEAETAKEYGVELLITDHHTLGNQLPDAAAICHADLPAAEKYPFPHLCGAAVALKVSWAVGQLANNGLGQPVSSRFRERLKEMLGLAALGTVADFVPLRDENRALVRGGLPFLAPKFASGGLKNLLEKAHYSSSNKSGTKNPMSAEFAAFQIAPRINAVGRLGQAGLAVELLLSSDNNRTKQIAEDIEVYNEERKRIEKEIYKEAEKQIEERFEPQSAPAFVLAGDWHRGVIGIVAGRLADKYHRPVILLGRDKMGLNPAVGSARSVADFNLYAAIEACGEYLIRFGGHAGAAGVTLAVENIDAFRSAFCRYVAERITPEERIAELHIEGVFPLGAFTVQTVREILSLAPFGCENPSPIFVAEGVTVQNVRPMGRDGSHFSADFFQSGGQHGIVIRGIAFNRRDWVELMQPYDTPMDIAFKARISDYSGKAELDILDWRRNDNG
ncbi:MAG: single-stranded-DNA-specific exonuclease RecJ [Planctomycetaceae bacterium]|jgi:single-stranded-DNA-specific exonuclease|nr:single-stranded-DNA-specific exonuclease RecJ [Planctomycetaceae bacterium]